ncbi:MAG: SDR family oxidoreductase [Chitinophagaceae bacterium]|nr:SDR family oxidoreductase [Chitinophagaceae bacterium]
MNIAGNTILITGGSSGIGLSLAQKLLESGNKVIITGRDKNKLAAIQQKNPGLHICAGDLAGNNGIGELVEHIRQKHPDLNVLINNAGVQFNYTFITEQELTGKIDYEILSNLAAPIKLTNQLLSLLLTQRNAAIVNVSSALCLAPKKSAAVYCATKAGIHSYSKALRFQLEGTPVKVFEVIPPLVDTPMTDGRGKAKMSSDEVAVHIIRSLSADRYEAYIGKSKLLRLINRIMPSLAERIMKNG